MNALNANIAADFPDNALRAMSGPIPGQRYLDRDGRTIEVLAFAAKTAWRPTCITVHVPHHGEEHWSLYTWETLIAVGPLVELDAA